MAIGGHWVDMVWTLVDMRWTLGGHAADIGGHEVYLRWTLEDMGWPRGGHAYPKLHSDSLPVCKNRGPYTN